MEVGTQELHLGHPRVSLGRNQSEIAVCCEPTQHGIRLRLQKIGNGCAIPSPQRRSCHLVGHTDQFHSSSMPSGLEKVKAGGWVMPDVFTKARSSEGDDFI